MAGITEWSGLPPSYFWLTSASRISLIFGLYMKEVIWNAFSSLGGDAASTDTSYLGCLVAFKETLQGIPTTSDSHHHMPPSKHLRKKFVIITYIHQWFIIKFTNRCYSWIANKFTTKVFQKKTNSQQKKKEFKTKQKPKKIRTFMTMKKKKTT